LTTSEPLNREIFVLGPQLLTYDDVAAALTKALGRTITHEKLSVKGLVKRLMDFGVPEPSAQGLAGMDVAISQGAEERTNDDVLTILGRQPKSLAKFIEENERAWAPSGEKAV
jgi:festuclavine dehydrogenase